MILSTGNPKPNPKPNPMPNPKPKRNHGALRAPSIAVASRFVILAIVTAAPGALGAELLNEGDLLVASRYSDETGSRAAIVAVDPETGEQRLVSEGGLLREATALAIDSAWRIYVFVNRNNAAGAWVQIDPDSGEQTLLRTRDPYSCCPVAAVAGEDGNLLLARDHRTLNTAMRLHSADPRTTEERQIYWTAGVSHTAVDVARESADTALLLEGHSNTVLRVELSTGDVSTAAVGGSLARPTAIALASPGDLLVADLGSVAPSTAEPAAELPELPFAPYLVRIDLDAIGDEIITVVDERLYPTDIGVRGDGTIAVLNGFRSSVGPLSDNVGLIDGESGVLTVLADDGLVQAPSRIAWVPPYVAPTPCSDHVDNDEDGAIDFPADPGCASAEGDSELPVDLIPRRPQRLEPLPDEHLPFDARDISHDGQVMLGEVDDGVADHPFPAWWRPQSGPQLLPRESGMSVRGSFSLSADGTRALLAIGSGDAALWTLDEAQATLHPLLESLGSAHFAQSGSRLYEFWGGGIRVRAVVESEGTLALGPPTSLIDAPEEAIVVAGSSMAGDVVVGHVPPWLAPTPSGPFVWTEGAGTLWIEPPAQHEHCTAGPLTYDGATLIVQCDTSCFVAPPGTCPSPRSYLWSETAGFQPLGIFPPTQGGELPINPFHAQAMSSDGRRILGSAELSGDALWEPTRGIVPLPQELERLGYDADFLADALPILLSGDGRTLVYWGRGPDGFYDTWLVRLPEAHPRLLALAACGALLMLRRRGR